ncbi:MAG: hypothetical protein FJ009_16850 [Chloroflexi bacterium]|nr:hypothetical protein [Chloroflexota bacterium]
MSSVQPVQLSPRARAYFEQNFKPQYEQLQRAVRQTPLAILVWGPGASAGDLYQKRAQIRDELRRRGHAAFFSEDLAALSPATGSQKGIEFLQAQAADLIVVMQASYGSVAEVHDFAEHRVINFKMLIFIDERATDGYSYRGALQELKTLYNNVETYRYPDDITQCHLLTKVLAKVDVLQAVKYRVMQNAASWGLSAGGA